MAHLLLLVALILCGAAAVRAFQLGSSISKSRQHDFKSLRKATTQKNMMLNDFLSLPLAETTVSEEEILDVVGRASDLPDPIVSVSITVFILVGVAILQFSLGDLTKEEGQARVRDFLATKRETERKRGYFD